MNYLTTASEPAKQGLKVGKDKISGLLFADDSEGISDAPGVQTKVEKAL